MYACSNARGGCSCSGADADATSPMYKESNVDVIFSLADQVTQRRMKVLTDRGS
jgi:hypothetical protein